MNSSIETRWRTVVAVLIVASLFATLLATFGPRVLWRFEENRIDGLLAELEESAPVGVSKDDWDRVFEVTHNGVANVCAAPGFVTLNEMRGFRVDLEAELEKPIKLETLRWIWERLGETGAHGKDYTDKTLPLFEEAVEGLEIGEGKGAEKRTGAPVPFNLD